MSASTSQHSVRVRGDFRYRSLNPRLRTRGSRHSDVPLALSLLALVAVLLFPLAACCGELSPPVQLAVPTGSDSLALSPWNVIIARDAALQSVEMNTLNQTIWDALQLMPTDNPHIWIILHRFGNPAPQGVVLPELQSFAKLGTEGYTLVVDSYASKVRITVAAAAEHGIFNGAMTALQLLLRGNGLEAGAREDSIKPQTIKDYPDHPIRGAEWLKIQLGSVVPYPATGTYSLKPAHQARIDFLARHKVNLLFLSITLHDLSLEENVWLNQNGRQATADLIDYCKKRFVDVVPKIGMPQYEWKEYVDGWWSKDKCFEFSYQDWDDLAFNGSFEEDTVDADSLPDGWKVGDAASPASLHPTDWTYGIDPNTGSRVMTLRQSTARLTPIPLSQVVRVRPSGGNPMSEYTYYGAFVRQRGSGLGLQFVMACLDSNFSGIPGSSRVATLSPSSDDPNYRQLYWSSGDWSGISPVRVTPSTQYIEVLVRASDLDAHPSGWRRLDWVYIVPMDSSASGYHVIYPGGVGPRAVPSDWCASVSGDMPLNPSMEYSSLSGRPYQWTVTADGLGDSLVADTLVTRDSIVARSGQASLKLTVPEGLDSTTQQSIIAAQVIQAPDSTAGTYRLTAWVKTCWTQSGGGFPELNLYAVNADSSIGECTGITIDAGHTVDADTTDWVMYQTDLTVAARRDRFVLYAHMMPSSYGTVWLDDVTIIKLPTPAPLANLNFNSSMEVAGQDGLPEGLEDQLWRQDDEEPSGWSRVSSHHHTGAHSLRFDGSAEHLYVGTSDAVGKSFNDVTPGRYLLTAWVLATARGGAPSAMLDTLPQVYLYADDFANHFVSAKGVPRESDYRWYTDRWTKIQGIFTVYPEHPAFGLLIRCWQAGECYIDDICIRYLDGDLHNTLDRLYEPEVTRAPGETEPLAYSIQRAPLESRYDETSVPTRIFNLYFPGPRISASYDQLLYWNYERAWEQSSNLCVDCPHGMLQTFYRRATNRVLGVGAKGIDMTRTELRGFNRSGATAAEDASNADVLAHFMNAWMDSIPTSNSVYNCSDMLTPYHNGGVEYERAFGGRTGVVADCTADQSLNQRCRIRCWFYKPEAFGAMSATAKYFEDKHYYMTQDTWKDSTNVLQASAVSLGTTRSLGGVATTWQDTPADTLEADQREQIMNNSNRFWKTPWRQVYFTDFNYRLWSNDSSSYRDNVEYVNPDAQGIADTTKARLRHWCAPSWAPASDGAIRFTPGGEGSLTLPAIPVDNGATYQIVLHSRDLLGRPVGETAPLRSVNVIARWCKSPFVTVPYDSTIAGALWLGGPGQGQSAIDNFFTRTTQSIVKPPGTTKYDHLVLRIAAGSGPSSLVLDDVAIWESDAPCPDSDLDLNVPSSKNLGELPAHQKYSFTFDLQNRGCRDVTITALSTVHGATPPDALTFKDNSTQQVLSLPRILSKGETLTVKAESVDETESGSAVQYKVRVDFEATHSSTSRNSWTVVQYWTGEDE